MFQTMNNQFGIGVFIRNLMSLIWLTLTGQCILEKNRWEMAEMHLKKIFTGLIATSGFLALSAVATTTNASAATFKSNGYAITKKTIKTDGYTIPTGTRVQLVNVGTKSGKTIGSIQMARLSYKLHSTQKINGSWHTSSIQITSSRFSATSAKAADSLPVYLMKGKNFTTFPSFESGKTLRVTSDGYIQYYNQENDTIAPASSTKVTASKKVGNKVYIYAKTNMPGLPDKHIKSKTGKYNYRLTIRNNNKTLKSTSDGEVIHSESYSIGTGSNYFYFVNTAD